MADQEIPDCDNEPDGSMHCGTVYPGTYLISVWGNQIPGYYLKSVMLGDQDVRFQQVTLDRGAYIRAIYRPNAARVLGSVEGGAGAVAVLLDADQSREDAFQAVRVTRCDAEGRFSFEGLYPASYYAFAFVPNGNVETGALRAAAFALGLKEQAQLLRLNEGDNVTLNLKLLAFPE